MARLSACGWCRLRRHHPQALKRARISRYSGGGCKVLGDVIHIWRPYAACQVIAPGRGIIQIISLCNIVEGGRLLIGVEEFVKLRIHLSWQALIMRLEILIGQQETGGPQRCRCAGATCGHPACGGTTRAGYSAVDVIAGRGIAYSGYVGDLPLAVTICTLHPLDPVASRVA